MVEQLQKILDEVIERLAEADRKMAELRSATEDQEAKIDAFEEIKVNLESAIREVERLHEEDLI